MKIELYLDNAYQHSITTYIPSEYVNDLDVRIHILNHLTLDKVLGNIYEHDIEELLRFTTVAMIDNDTIFHVFNLVDICGNGMFESCIPAFTLEPFVNCVKLYICIRYLEKMRLLNYFLDTLFIRYSNRKDIINYLLKLGISPTDLTNIIVRIAEQVGIDDTYIKQDYERHINDESMLVLDMIRVLNNVICETIDSICRRV